MFDLRQFAIRYRLGLQDTESLVQAANILLEEGHTEPAVVELSILTSPIMAEAAPLFERVCAELAIAVPNKDEAIDQLIRSHLESITSGIKSPHDGLEAIMREVYDPHFADEPCNKYVGDSRGMEHLIGAYWSYDDLRERPQEVSFDGKYGSKAIARWEEFVKQHAQAWLDVRGVKATVSENASERTGR